ncbi:uncharacterized protein A4U43_C05F15840 [Asparagus officinalis]|uniref:Uncharacterized protein n=1 Tax=Asparagus officinalis TaxID=4686 RepID=A0A5P1ERY0_ASPOF|nr:uncharacterized protein A4U43_C05F15840 [Asparagus officinalis]
MQDEIEQRLELKSSGDRDEHANFTAHLVDESVRLEVDNSDQNEEPIISHSQETSTNLVGSVNFQHEDKIDIDNEEVAEDVADDCYLENEFHDFHSSEDESDDLNEVDEVEEDDRDVIFDPNIILCWLSVPNLGMQMMCQREDTIVVDAGHAAEWDVVRSLINPI